ERAQAFCNARGARLALLDGEMLHLQASIGLTIVRDHEAQFPRPVSTDTMFGRAILACDVVQTPDVSIDPDHFLRNRVQAGPVRAIIAVPMLRAGVPIGAIALTREQPGEFSDTEVELLRTFAEQAVIAVVSAETYRELQDRTAALARRNREFSERIEQQAAT